MKPFKSYLVAAACVLPVTFVACTDESSTNPATDGGGSSSGSIDGSLPEASTNCLVSSACCVLAQEKGQANPREGAPDCSGEDLGGKMWCGAAAELLKKALKAQEVEGECVIGLNPGTVTRVPIVWVNSTNEDKVALFDSTTGKEILRVPTWGNFPNRTAVATNGSIWITNRDSFHYIHIGLDGKPVCASEYGNTQPAGPAKVGYTRAAAIDPDGFAWIGFNDTGEVVKLDPKAADGTVTLTDPNSVPPATTTVPKCKEVARVKLTTTRPYGLAADGDGNLWVGILGSGTVAKINSKTNAIIGEYNIQQDPKMIAPVDQGGSGGCFSFYGMAIDADGNPWFANLGCGNVVKLDKTTGKITSVIRAGAPGAPDPNFTSPRAIGLDKEGHLWVADNSSQYTHEFLPDGKWVKKVDVSCPGKQGYGTLGTGTDIDGNVWTVLQNDGQVSKYKTDGTKIGCYPATPTPQLSSPYTYSDLTGSTNALVTSQLGRVRAVVTKDVPIQWALVSDKQKVPAGTSVCVRVRAANNAAELQTASFTKALCDWKQIGEYSALSLVDKDGKFLVAKTTMLEVELQLNSQDSMTTPTVSNLSVAGIK